MSHYTTEDVVELFQLPAGYTLDDVDFKAAALQEELFREAMPPEAKVEIQHFLNGARDLVKRDWTKPKMQFNDVIPRPNIPYFPTHIEEYTKGDINPYKKQTVPRLLNIDALFRPNFEATAPTNFSLQLETVRNAVSMELESFAAPCRLFPTFSATMLSNKLIFTTGVVVTLTIPDGDYAPDEFEVVVNTLLLDAALGLKMQYYNGRIVFCALDPATPVSYTLTFGDGTVNQTSGTKMGFKLPSYTSVDTFQVVGGDGDVQQTFRSYVGAELYLRNERCTYFFLEVDDYQNNHTINGLVTNIPGNPGNNLLTRIDVRDDVVRVSPNKRDYLGPVRIEKLNLRLLDRHGDEATWVRNYSCALKLSVVYS